MSSTAEEIYERMQRQKDEQAQQLRLNVGNEVAPDYDTATRIFAVEARTQLPYQVVEADLPNLEDKLRRDDFDSRRYTNAENGSPVFNEFAAEHPYHVAVLDRDWESLTGVERAWQQINLGWDSGRAMGEIEEIRSRQLDNFENPDQEKDKARLKELDQLLEGGMFGADAWYTKTLVGTAQQIPIQAWLVAESLDEVAIGTVTGAGIGAAYGAPVGGVGALPGAATGALTGAGRGFLVGRTEAAFRLERALAYHEYLGMGLKEEEARWAATAVGSVNAALESIGLGALTKRIPGFKQIQNDAVGAMINSVLRKPTMKHAIARASLMYGEGVATELVTEILQESTLMAAGELLKSYERERGNLDPTLAPITSGEFWNRVGDTAAHTLYGVALIAGGGPLSNYVSDTIRIRQAEGRLAALEAMGESSEKSETRKNAPTKYAEFVKKLTKDGKVLIEARKFFEYFQEQGMDPEEVAVSIGVTNLGEAVTNGHDLEMDAGEYIVKVASTNHHRGLMGDLKRSAGEMSGNEAQVVKAAMVKEVNELQALQAKENPEQAREDAEIHAKIKERLIEGGTSPEAAEFQAMILVGIPNLARRAGATDIEAFQEERFGGVIFTTNKQMRIDKEDVDLFVDPLIDKLRAGDIPTQRSIFGPNLIDIIKASGGLMPDSELSARDMGKQFRGLVREGGRSLDDIAEVLHEQGYIARRDPELVLEALDRMVGGEEIFGDQFTIREDQRELLGALDQLARDLEMAKIDITDMSNAEVRAALNAIETYFQSDETIETTQLDLLTKVALDAARHDPLMLSRAEALLPPISPEQDFGDIKFTEDYTLAGTKQQVAATRTANKEFEIASERKNTLKALKDCLGG